MQSVDVATTIEQFRPRTVSTEVARFAKGLAAAASPESQGRARAFLFAASRLGAFGEAVGLDLSPEALVRPSVIDRCCHPDTTTMSAPTRRTVRTNLRAMARRVYPAPPPPALSRERAKAPYTSAEIAAYLGLADAQPTRSRRLRAQALICVGAGAGVVGGDLKAVRGTDVVERSGGVVVDVRAGRRPRSIPVLRRYHDRLVESASWAGEALLIGGASPQRRNVTTPLIASLAGGLDLPRFEVARLRATWLCEVAREIGLRALMDAAGITCSQRLGDLAHQLDAVEEAESVALLGGLS
jgi:integrase